MARGAVAHHRRPLVCGPEKAVSKLGQNPERQPIAEDESEQVGFTLRQMLYGRRRGVYLLLFSVEGDTVVLHYVRHSARGPISREDHA